MWALWAKVLSITDAMLSGKEKMWVFLESEIYNKVGTIRWLQLVIQASSENA